MLCTEERGQNPVWLLKLELGLRKEIGAKIKCSQIVPGIEKNNVKKEEVWLGFLYSLNLLTYIHLKNNM